MAQRSQFWNTSGVGDGPGPAPAGYTLDNWRDLFYDAFGDGVTGAGSRLAVSGAASPLTVGTGSAFAYGFYYENDSALSLPVTTPAATTGGHVVLELSWSAQTVRAKVVQNTSGNTAIPALVQTPGTTYQIRLASYQITNTGVITLTDARPLPTIIGSGLRLGGSASVPGTSGTTTYSSPTLTPQVGVVASTNALSPGGQNQVITFARPFASTPIITGLVSSNDSVTLSATASTTGLLVRLMNTSGSTIAAGQVTISFRVEGVLA